MSLSIEYIKKKSILGDSIDLYIIERFNKSDFCLEIVRLRVFIIYV